MDAAADEIVGRIKAVNPLGRIHGTLFAGHNIQAVRAPLVES